MKKIFILLFVSIFMLSCSSNEETVRDTIVGNWGLFSITGTEVSDCEKQSSITFSPSQNAFDENYHINPVNNNCEKFTTDEIVTWQNMGSNVYRITFVNSRTTD